VFSAFNALTLSPALCAIFLEKERVDNTGAFFSWFNKWLDFFRKIYVEV
jgi:multidrug efflux pump subunit AcrB